MIAIGIGSNLGDRLAVMKMAAENMQRKGIMILNQAPVYETPAWGGQAEGPFLNSVLQVEFPGSAPDLLDLLLDIELQMGRKRTVKWGNRILDLDLLEFRRQTWHHPRLTLPHPGYTRRAFVLVPFSDLHPYFIPTGQVQTISQLLLSCPVSDIQRASEKAWI